MILPAFFRSARRTGAALAIVAALATPAMAQSQDAAQVLVRIQELEEQIRNLTGQVEGLQFQLTQMQTLVQRMTEDNEFRFQQLEGTSGAATPRLPSAETPVETATVPDTTPLADPAPLDLGAAAPVETLGESSDPLVGTNATGGGTIGTLDAGRPLDLSLDGGVELSNGDATAQYNAGYDAIVRGDYAFAEDQFQQFIALYPDDPNAPDAINWLGEALIQRGDYESAARVLAEGYEKYVESPRAPDLMLKLGIAIVGLGEVDVACRTFFTLEKRYPGLSPAFLQRLSEEKSKAQCPV